MEGFREHVTAPVKMVMVFDNHETLSEFRAALVAERPEQEPIIVESTVAPDGVVREGKWYTIDGRYRIRYDPGNPAIPVDDHLHCYVGNNEIAAFTSQGQSHDNWTGRIPRVFADFIQEHLPQFKIPNGRYVEEAELESWDGSLCLVLEVQELDLKQANAGG